MVVRSARELRERRRMERTRRGVSLIAELGARDIGAIL